MGEEWLRRYTKEPYAQMESKWVDERTAAYYIYSWEHGQQVIDFIARLKEAGHAYDHLDCMALIASLHRGRPRNMEGPEARPLQITEEPCKCYASEEGEILYRVRDCSYPHGDEAWPEGEP